MAKKITRNEATAQIIKLMYNGYSIPTCSLGNGGAGFGWVGPNTDINAILNICLDSEKYSFNIIPMDDIAEDFEDNIEPDEYEVCVEFKENKDRNPHREQYLFFWGDLTI